jgi:hypothetical protein
LTGWRGPSSPCRDLLPVKNGEKFAGRDDGTSLATLAIGEIIAEVELLPVLHGEKMPAGR